MSSTTIDQLLSALRTATGIDDLDWATPPTPLQGGFWAEMFTVELAKPPAALAGRLVARIMPDPDTAEFETAIQRHVRSHGLSVPTIRAASGPTAELDRAWMLTDHAAGTPMLDGLTASTAIRRARTLYRQLPDLLAEAAAALHRCPTDGPEIERFRQRVTVEDFLDRIAAQARGINRDDLARIALALADRAPGPRVVCHGDLHPFNLLVADGRWTILDWSTAVVADPHYDLGFTTLMLSNPPLGGPAPVRALAVRIGRRLADRFLVTYSRLSGMSVDPERLAWGQTVHAVRAITELASWDYQGSADEHRGHPWTALRPVFEARLAAHS